MKRIVLIVMLVAVLITGFGLAGCSSSPEPEPVNETDNLAPDFQLKSLDGKDTTLREFRGKPVMLNFWATWCPPCRAEMPYIQAVFEDQELLDRGLVILAINVGEGQSRVEEFMEANGLSFTVLLDTDANIAQNYNVRGIPATFFIGKDGIIEDRKIGSFSSKAEIEQRLVDSIMKNE